MRNYLEHEEEVRFVDCYLAKSRNWQWFVDIVEEHFDLEDVHTYLEFENKNGPLRRILGNFIKVVGIGDVVVEFRTDLLNDIFILAQYSVGIISITDCLASISTNMGKILCAAIWLTKLENADNGTDYVIDMRFFSQRNLFQAIDMQSFQTELDAISVFLNNIVLDGFDSARRCVIDNLENVQYEVSSGFFEKFNSYMISPNAFNYQSIPKPEVLTWQEVMLLDMLAISIDDDKITPLYHMGKSMFPDVESWSSSRLEAIKNFFNNPSSDFIVESVDYVKNAKVPTQCVVDLHCKLLKGLIDEGDEFNVITSSSYKIVALLFKKADMKNIEKKDNVLELIKTTQKIESAYLLTQFKEDGFPITKSQNSIIRQDIIAQFQRIRFIDTIYELKDYLSNRQIAKNIEQEYYNMIMPKFVSFLDNSRQQMIPLLFWEAMLFLFTVNEANQNVDKRIVKNDMIAIQELWQTQVYATQCDTLQSFEYSMKIPTEEIEKYNNTILFNPILIAKNCMLPSNEDMVNAMTGMSEHAILYLVQKFHLTPVFPIIGDEINYANHDIDSLLRQQIENLVEKYGYKFLNNLGIDTYVSGIHEKYQANAFVMIPMFHKEEELYHTTEQYIDIQMIPYNSDVKLGHLTQLFKILEMQIRKLGKMFGIVPFKEKASEVMRYKDPSSVLREILEEIYQELGDFENVPDLLFVYHFMYNGNSINIRNECVHGRDYCEGYRLKFAFRVTLLALYMIIYRIRVIEKNMAP